MTEDERRSVRVQVMLTPAERDQLDRFAEANYWSRSTAAQVLITKGLGGEKKEEDRR